MFEKDIYLARRTELKKKVGHGILLFLGNEESPMNYAANTYHFRQDSTFLYYFGINSPSLAAVIDIDEDNEVIFGDEMNIDELVWNGRLETLDEKSLKSGIRQIHPSRGLAEFISRVIPSSRKIHFLPPYRAENKIRLTGLLNIDLKRTKELASVEFIRAVVEQRSVKGHEEIREIERALTRTVEMHRLALRTARPGMYESELAALIHQEALKDGGNLAYPVILTRNGHILHNYDRSNILKDGDLVLNDSGAETSMSYCADLTRTFPAGKKFSKKQKEVYEIVLESLNQASGKLAPGIKYLDIHFTACKALAAGLKELGLMKGDIDDAVAAGAHALFFQCGTGHMMGMDVHDMEDLGEELVGYDDQIKKEQELFGLKSLRLGKGLKPGFVLTVEPGIYFNPFLTDLWRADKRHAEFIRYENVERYRNFGGIRIEDNFLITTNGSKLLGEPLEKTIQEIEALRYHSH